jgi:hypothetical protein
MLEVRLKEAGANYARPPLRPMNRDNRASCLAVRPLNTLLAGVFHRPSSMHSSPLLGLRGKVPATHIGRTDPHTTSDLFKIISRCLFRLDLVPYLDLNFNNSFQPV